MGKKRKFNRFIRWIKSDLPEENKSVLLLGVTKIPSPTPAPRLRPHTLHLDHHLQAKSQTLDSCSRLKPRLFRSHSKDSLNELLTYRSEANLKRGTTSNSITVNKTSDCNRNGNLKTNCVQNNTPINSRVEPKANDVKLAKHVSFDTNNLNSNQVKDTGEKKLGFCTELPYEYYHSELSEESQTDESNVTDFVMDKSVDSIGSCSLDVDASSTDFSDSSVESSNCTLRSLGIPTPTTQPSNYLPTFRIEPQSIATDTVEPKKPSYLNLACTVNGYSNITNYDSKLRENFRISKSREVSPIRPQDYHANFLATQNGDRPKFLTPNYPKSLLSPSNTMTESKSQTILRSSQTSSYSYANTTMKTVSFMSKESRNFASSMLYNSDADVIDAASFGQKTNGVHTKYSNFENSKSSHTSYTTHNGKTSNISESCSQESYSNGQEIKTKSFIQQRVERLYGPGALAQGFFINKRMKSRLSESENSENTTPNGTPTKFPVKVHDKVEIEADIKQNSNSPSLPVLRHLRPEFRAQLPILSPKKIHNDFISKNNTVPSSLTSPSNGFDEPKISLNGLKPANSTDHEVVNETIIKPIQQVEDLNSVKIIPEEIPAAPQVILPISKPVTEIIVNGSDTDCTMKPEIKDGHYFLKILKTETDRLVALAEKAEAELEEKKTILGDDVLGYLRSASGKARLLVNQKMQQFEGLCHKNINQKIGEPFPTTPEDLQGFWDMVMLQVTQIDDLFTELDNLRANNWVIQEKQKPDIVDNSTKPKKVIVKKAVSANAEAQRKQREAARKKMIEDRRKAMRNKQPQSEQGIEIYVPESS